MKNNHISTTIWPVGTKFGKITYTDPPNGIAISAVKNMNFSKSKIADGRQAAIWKI